MFLLVWRPRLLASLLKEKCSLEERCFESLNREEAVSMLALIIIKSRCIWDVEAEGIIHHNPQDASFAIDDGWLFSGRNRPYMPDQQIFYGQMPNHLPDCPSIQRIMAISMIVASVFIIFVYNFITTQPLMSVNERDLQLFQKLQQQQLQQQQADIQPPSPVIGFIIHAVLKAIVIGLFVFKGIFAAIFSQLVMNELIAIFVVIDFWFTKNIAGKQMIGVRWFFQNDEYGTEKFMFECRANEEYVSLAGTKMFWLVLMAYTVFPMIMVVLGIVQAPLVFINFTMIIISIGILIGGGSNLFFFYQAQGVSSLRQKELKRKIGVDLLRRLKTASITSYT